MKCRLSARGLLAAASAVLALLPIEAVAGAVDDEKETRPTAGLYYEVIPLQQEVTVGERLGFRLQLHNYSDLPVTVFWPGDPYVDVYRFSVTANGVGEVSSPQGLSAPIGLAKYFRQIPRGGHLEYSVFWAVPRSSANCQEYTFKWPGSYTVQPSFHVAVRSSFDPETGDRKQMPGAWTGTLESMPIEIHVLAPPRKTGEGGVRLTGHVVDLDGKAVEGAMVLVKKRMVSPLDPLGLSMSETGRAFTGPDGAFLVEGLDEADPFFDVICSHPSYPEARLRLTPVPPKRDYELRFAMEPGITLRGRVLDTAGSALAGACVSEDGELGKRVYTDEQGAFEMRGAAGRREVHVWKPGYQGAYYPVPSGQTEAGGWEIVLRNTAELTVSGRAAFRDGRPAADLQLSLALTDRDGRNVHARARTDGWGRFVLVLAGDGPLSGTAWVEEEGSFRAGLTRRWRTSVEGLTPRARDVELVFDDRGSVEVSVEPASELPRSVEFAVHCSVLGDDESHWRPVAVQRLGAAGGMVSFSNLSPGRYRTQVVVTKAEHWNWTQEVELPEDQGAPGAAVRYCLPELRFGNLRARVLQPDGKTPFGDGRAWLDHTAAWGSVEIKDGRIELKDLPVGQAWLTIRPQGYARTGASGTVRAGETTDLGDIVLKSEEAGTGWVEGRILYDDGSPALGAAIEDGGFQVRPVNVGGRFRAQLPAGSATLVVALNTAHGWPEAHEAAVAEAPDSASVYAIRGRPWHDTVLVSVDVKAGRTVEQDVILRREGQRNMRLVWKGDPPKRLRYDIHVGGEGQHFVRSGFAWETRDGELTVEHVPAGRGVVTLRTDDTDDYTGHAELPAETGDVALTFDPANAGCILGRLTRENGEGAARVHVVICLAALSSFGPVEGIRTAFWPVDAGRTTLQSDEDGVFRSHRLGAGTYVVETSPVGTSAAQVVELGPGQTARVDLITSAASRGAPPLRSTGREPPVDGEPAAAMSLEEAAGLLKGAHAQMARRNAHGEHYLAMAVRPGDAETRQSAWFWLFSYAPGTRPELIARPRSLPGLCFTIRSMSVNGHYPWEYIDEHGDLHSLRSENGFLIGADPWLIAWGSTSAECELSDDLGNLLQFSLRPQVAQQAAVEG